MKILFISHSSELYGAPKSMLYLIKDLKVRYNVDPIVLTPERGMLTYELDKLGIKYIVNKYYLSMIPKDCSLMSRFVHKLRYKYINKLLYLYIYLSLYNQEIDIVHTNTSVCDIGDYLAKKINKPHIWHIREFGLEDHNMVYIENIDKIRGKYNSSYKIICVSKSIEKKYSSIIDKGKLVTIYNGIDFNNSFHKNFKYEKYVNFCIAGSISEGKNQIEAIKSVKILKDLGCNNFRLHIIGDGSNEYLQYIISFLKENKIEEYVIVTSFTNDIDKVFEKMDVGIITSKKEAFGRVTVEYMSKYMPVIGSNCGATTEIIEHNINGFLYTLGDSVELAKYMKYFIENREQIETMGKNAYKISYEKFKLEENTNRIYNIYAGLYK